MNVEKIALAEVPLIKKRGRWVEILRSLQPGEAVRFTPDEEMSVGKIQSSLFGAAKHVPFSVKIIRRDNVVYGVRPAEDAPTLINRKKRGAA